GRQLVDAMVLPRHWPSLFEEAAWRTSGSVDWRQGARRHAADPGAGANTRPRSGIAAPDARRRRGSYALGTAVRFATRCLGLRVLMRRRDTFTRPARFRPVRAVMRQTVRRFRASLDRTASGNR